MMQEITIEEVYKLPDNTYRLIDIRDDVLVSYGMIPDAIHIKLEDLQNNKLEKVDTIPIDKTLIFYCQIGRKTQQLSDLSFLSLRNCFSLKDGYRGYISYISSKKANDAEKEKIEKDIQHKYHKQLFSPFARACKTYQLISEGDHIAICISGGKDSMLMAKLFQEIKRHNKVSFDLTFLVMDPGYSPENRKLIESNAERLGIPISVFDTRIFDAVDKIDKNPCYICARMRRGHLYNKAKELGCNKIALGHHYDDVIETIMMGMLYGGQTQTMMPKLHSSNFEKMELIRPMYFIREDDIKSWAKYYDLHFLQCACHFTDTCTTCHADGTTSSKRLETKKLIAELKKKNPYIEANIFKSVENINLDTVLSYKKDGIKHNFLDEY